MPDLRIVPQGLWDRVKARQREQQEKSTAVRKALHGNARTGAGPKYLFSGLLTCACCGASYTIVDSYRYGCSTHENRGEAACSNAIKVPRKLVEERLLEGIKRDLFTPEAIDLFKRETSRLLAQRRARRAPERGKINKRLAEVENEITNIMTAIKAGILTPTTKAELERAESERADLMKALKANASGIEQAPSVLPHAVDRYRDLVIDLETVTLGNVGRARTQS